MLLLWYKKEGDLKVQETDIKFFHQTFHRKEKYILQEEDDDFAFGLDYNSLLDSRYEND